jgi:antitoxin ParD1/3/4
LTTFVGALDWKEMRQDITTINISLPKKLRAKVERKIAREAYGSTSEYVRDLIRKDLSGDAIAKVDELLLQGLHSGKPKPVDESFWRRLEAEVKKASRRSVQKTHSTASGRG